jgi:PadR family transcriptional regulator, regulatory protein PadR
MSRTRRKAGACQDEADYLECYIGMSQDVKLSHTAALILRTIECGYYYGFDVMDVTGLPSGTVYPALRRLERDGLISAKWEDESIAAAGQRPARRYYRVTRLGRQSLVRLVEKYPLLDRLVLARKD